MTTPQKILEEMISAHSLCIDSGHCTVVASIQSLRKALDRINKECGWIPVTERLPEHEYGYFLGANCYTRFSGEVAWDKEKFEFRKGKYKQKITHWREIPEAPEWSHMESWQSVARNMGASEDYIQQKCISLKQKYLPHNPSSHD